MVFDFGQAAQSFDNILGFNFSGLFQFHPAFFRKHYRKHGSGANSGPTSKSPPAALFYFFGFGVNPEPEAHHVAAGRRADHPGGVEFDSFFLLGFQKIFRTEKMVPKDRKSVV